jgi:ankyrin repeat protein
LINTFYLDECHASLCDFENVPSCLCLVSSQEKIIIDCGDRQRSLLLLFALHRAAKQVMETPFFLFTQWMDKAGWFRAAEDVDEEKLKQYLEVSPSYCELRDDTGSNAAKIVCSKGRLDLASLLLTFGSDFLQKGKYGLTAMHALFQVLWAENDIPYVVRFLETLSSSEKVTFSEPTDDGMTPLHLNIMDGRGCLIDFLLSKKVNLDFQNQKGATPIMIALRLNQIEAAMKLMDNGADLFVKTNKGDDALSAAKDLRNEEVYQRVFEQYESRRITQTRNIIQEIIDTEEAYFAQLQNLYFIFQTKLYVEHSLSRRAIDSVFGNVLDLYKGCEAFLSDISSVPSLSPEKQDMGSRILKHLPYFHQYVPYCRNQTISSKSLRVMLTEPTIKENVDSMVYPLPEKTIDSYLIKPVQRICRYQLLIRELLKYMNESYPDVVWLKKAAEEIAAILATANEQKRSLDEIEEYFEVFSSLGILFSSDSHYVGKGEFLSNDRSKRDVTYFIFSDCLIVAKGTHPKWNILEVILYADSPLIWRPQDSRGCFDITSRSNSSRVTFSFESEAETEAVIDQISEAIANYNSGKYHKDVWALSELQRPFFIEEMYAEGHPKW